MSRAAPVLIAFALLLPPLKAAAEAVQLADVLSTDDAKCLSELLRHYYDYPGDHSADVAELSRSAKVGRATLSRHEPQAYIFLFHNIGWCGSAGCLLFIGEKRKDRHCHLLYVSDGSEHSIDVLRKWDHGYRRLYTPCEARFDGRQYQQIRQECPTIDIQR